MSKGSTVFFHIIYYLLALADLFSVFSSSSPDMFLHCCIITQCDKAAFSKQSFSTSLFWMFAFQLSAHFAWAPEGHSGLADEEAERQCLLLSSC